MESSAQQDEYVSDFDLEHLEEVVKREMLEQRRNAEAYAQQYQQNMANSSGGSNAPPPAGTEAGPAPPSSAKQQQQQQQLQVLAHSVDEPLKCLSGKMYRVRQQAPATPPDTPPGQQQPCSGGIMSPASPFQQGPASAQQHQLQQVAQQATPNSAPISGLEVIQQHNKGNASALDGIERLIEIIRWM